MRFLVEKEAKDSPVGLGCAATSVIVHVVMTPSGPANPGRPRKAWASFESTFTPSYLHILT
jgi:hypothetical protein